MELLYSSVQTIEKTHSLDRFDRHDGRMGVGVLGMAANARYGG